MFTDRIVVEQSFQSKLLRFYFASAHTNRELHEDGPPNKLEENKHYQTNRTLGLSKQARERHDGVPVCEGEGWVPMRWFSRELAEKHLQLIVMMWLSG